MRRRAQVSEGDAVLMQLLSVLGTWGEILADRLWPQPLIVCLCFAKAFAAIAVDV